MRLLPVTTRTSLAARFDELLASRFAAQSLHQPIVRPDELPWQLAQCVTNLAPDCVWRAFRVFEEVFCAVARAPLCETGAIPGELEAYFVDGEGSVYSAAVWTRDSKHGWWLNSVVPLSFDCEHGWSMAPLMGPPIASDVASPVLSQKLLTACALPLSPELVRSKRVGRQG